MLDDVGAISLVNQQPEKALAAYEEGLKIRQEVFGEKHAETAASIDIIADEVRTICS